MSSDVSPTTKNPQPQTLVIVIGLLGLIGLGIGLRYLYVERMILHVDEFASLLSIKMILEKGAPILPTGIFHGKGVTYNYLGAGIAALFGFDIETIRYLTLGLSVLTIPLVYLVTVQLFENRWAGLVAATAFTVLPTIVLWGSRARMYTLATLMVFVVILVAWRGLISPKSRRIWTILLPVAVLVMLLSHLVTIVIVPALFLAYVGVDWLRVRPNLRQLNSWLEPVGLGVALVVASGLGYGLGREAGEVRQWHEEASLMANVIRALFDLRLARNFYNFFLSPENMFLTILALIGAAALGLKARRANFAKADWGALFIYIQLVATFLLLYGLVPSSIRDERHNFILLLPYLILAMAYGVLTILEYLRGRRTRSGAVSPPWLATGTSLILIAVLLISQWPGLNQLLFADEPRTYRYDQAMHLVAEYMAPGDKLLTVMPPAAYLYDRPPDYYANQHKPRYVEQENGQKIDYFTGGAYLDSVDDFYQAIDRPDRLWFVVDEKRLTVNYDAKFSQEIIHQMDLVDRVNDVLVFVERDEHWPLASTPEIPVEADFADQMRLVGYTTELDSAKLKLTLFWQPGDPIFNYKIFVHLRDQAGQVVAQADFLPFDNIVPMSQWRSEWQEDVIPTGTVLNLPPEIIQTDPSQYRLFVGLYVPELNSERVPLVSDISGENAVILTDLGS
ncbi:MAG: glycosyltransferase family 39 protein [Anaerolineae bacterium]|nr:glycosyltransferase family 39 protein [Anaerolineae bacterium]